MSVTFLQFGFLAPEVCANGTPPTVNGAFYADGDDVIYDFLMASTGARAEVWYYIDEPGDILYLALIVHTDVNDNVFGDVKDDAGDAAYCVDAGWAGSGSQHTAHALVRYNPTTWELHFIALVARARPGGKTTLTGKKSKEP